MIWNPEYECMERGELRGAAAAPTADDRGVGLRARAVLPRSSSTSAA